jgi:hypothetical protein
MSVYYSPVSLYYKLKRDALYAPVLRIVYRSTDGAALYEFFMEITTVGSLIV